MIEILRGDENNLEGKVTLFGELINLKFSYIGVHLSTDFHDLLDIMGIDDKKKEQYIKQVQDATKAYANTDVLFYATSYMANKNELPKTGDIWKIGKFFNPQRAIDEMDRALVTYITNYEIQRFSHLDKIEHSIVGLDNQYTGSDVSDGKPLIAQNNLPIATQRYFVPPKDWHYLKPEAKTLRNMIKNTFLRQIRSASKNRDYKTVKTLTERFWGFMGGFPYEMDVFSLYFSALLSKDDNDIKTELKLQKLIHIIHEEYDKAAEIRDKLTKIEQAT